ncbi:hypothetical protein ACVWXM_009225 [Bradyrhizobium sp. GM7.3]
MPNRLETYRVEAYNTAKQSENKMHDDNVARRFGFSGGLVPGVDVFAYMMHVPVARWGRDFLSRGLIEARFIKPVYDGETADVDATEHNGLLTIEVFSRTELCATGTASLPVAATAVSWSDYVEVPAIVERKPVNPATFETGKWLGTTPRRWAGQDAADYLADIREADPIFAQEGLGHPGLIQRVMNRVLVDNTILGPWIHVGSRMQLLSAARAGDEITARAKVTAELREEGPPLRRARRAGGCQRHDAAGALPAHRDLPAARAGGGVGKEQSASSHSLSFPAKAGNPVRRGSSVSHDRLWNTGSSAFADDDSGVCGDDGTPFTPLSPSHPGSRATRVPASAACRCA